jgi:hypothetical protein
MPLPWRWWGAGGVEIEKDYTYSMDTVTEEQSFLTEVGNLINFLWIRNHLKLDRYQDF